MQFIFDHYEQENTVNLASITIRPHCITCAYMDGLVPL